MRTVFDIFKSDLRAIVKSVFVLIIVLAMGTIPSLYAWINIYANWDPYADAGNVEVALASRDSGIDLKNGSHVNSAAEVIAEVKDDKDIKYCPLDDPEQAVEGVRSGRFYAAIIFEDGFTYDMHHFEEAVGDREAKLTYYTNIKKNAVASKMTDQASAKLLQDINSEYVGNMLTQYFGDAEKVADDIDTEEAADTALKQLTGTRDALHDFNAAVGGIMSAGGNVTQALDNAKGELDTGRRNGRADIEDAKNKIDQARSTIKDVSKAVDQKTEKLEKAIGDLQKTLDQLQGPIDEKTKEKLIRRAIENADRVLTILQDMRGMLPEHPKTTAGRVTADALDVMIMQTEHVRKLLQTDPTTPEIITDAEAIKEMVDSDLKPSFALMLKDIRKALKRSAPLLKSADGVLDDIDPVLDSAGSTVRGLDATLAGTQTMLTSLETKLDDIIEKVENAEESDRAEVLLDMLGGNPEEYSDFFSNLVEIKATELFEPVTYGAAMTPFYTIIALWVGGVMLVTLMNTNVNRRKFPRITEAEGFFGRFMIFFLIGQIQAVVVVLGNIFLLHCSPVHPWLMWLSAAFTSMVFVILIYALTLAFGDIGRAAVIVIMMIQIAGSSGTYPIEILPGIFSKIYLFFPFPYAIDAMREAICGLYGHAYVVYLAQLMVFFLVAVVLGVFVRKPFSGVKAFMSKKMKETEVL